MRLARAPREGETHRGASRIRSCGTRFATFVRSSGSEVPLPPSPPPSPIASAMGTDDIVDSVTESLKDRHGLLRSSHRAPKERSMHSAQLYFSFHPQSGGMLDCVPRSISPQRGSSPLLGIKPCITADAFSCGARATTEAYLDPGCPQSMLNTLIAFTNSFSDEFVSAVSRDKVLTMQRAQRRNVDTGPRFSHRR